VVAVAEAIQARRGAAEIDDHQEERGQRVEPEMRAEPGQSDRQGNHGGIGGVAEQPAQRSEQGAAQITSVAP